MPRSHMRLCCSTVNLIPENQFPGHQVFSLTAVTQVLKSDFTDNRPGALQGPPWPAGCCVRRCVPFFICVRTRGGAAEAEGL